MPQTAIGIDFGTTNSSIARALDSGEVELGRYPLADGFTDSYRSLLYLEKHKQRGIESWTGPEGIAQYLAADPKGRLIQSLKSFLTSRTLTSTEIFGRRRTFEDLISRILRDLRTKAEAQFGAAIKSAVVGRPVRFVGAEEDADNDYAQTRLEAAFHTAGFEDVHFEWEPVAAAHYYESTLDHDELILIGDFGGGTSDFSLIHVGPSIRKRGRVSGDLLGNAGVGLAGDAFDAKLIRHLVSPALGAGTNIRSVDKILPVPTWIYSKLERWHHLSFLRANDVMSILHSVRAQALEPKRIAALIHLINEDLGYQLHRAVQQVKFALSGAEEADFHFADGTIELNAHVKRASFEKWIADELRQIATCVDGLLTSAGVAAKDVEMVFLTGGSSFVPAVRRIFEARFGARIRAGNEFTSVARGLALKAADRTR
ncbi:MAG: Hsp70 family protein [Bryobacteraceae bacterium]